MFVMKDHIPLRAVSSLQAHRNDLKLANASYNGTWKARNVQQPLHGAQLCGKPVGITHINPSESRGTVPMKQ